jgi:hypothetical protein
MKMQIQKMDRGCRKNTVRNLRRLPGLVLLIFCVSAGPALAAGDSSANDSNARLNDILTQARQSVALFWGQFKSVTCTEKVTQEKLGKQGKVEHAQKSTYDYLALLDVEKDELSVEESRLERGKASKTKSIPMLVTTGIPTLLFVFHPNYRQDFEYQLDGDQLEGGKRLVKIRFRHVPGTRSTTALNLRGKNLPLDLQGTAWIDPDTGAIHKIIAGLAAPMTDINLKAMQMEVNYGSQKFVAGEDFYWLPSIATIDIQTERQHWHNTHQFSQYKRFSINTETGFRHNPPAEDTRLRVPIPGR